MGRWGEGVSPLLAAELRPYLLAAIEAGYGRLWLLREKEVRWVSVCHAASRLIEPRPKETPAAYRRRVERFVRSQLPRAVGPRQATFVAVEKNPVAFRYLEANLRLNGVDDRVRALLGDNRELALEPRSFDRILLGYLPSSLPWLARAVGLLASGGGTVHAHLVVDARDARRAGEAAVSAELARCGASPTGPVRGREVKPYGPGRTHVVVDAPVRPPR